MLKQPPQLIIGTVICLILAGYYGYTIVSSYRTTNQMAEVKPVVDPNIFASKTFIDITSKTANGDLPLSVTDGELGIANPFQ